MRKYKRRNKQSARKERGVARKRGMTVAVTRNGIYYKVGNRLCKTKNNRAHPRSKHTAEIIFGVDFVIQLSEADKKQKIKTVSGKQKNIVCNKRKRRNGCEIAYYTHNKICRRSHGKNGRYFKFYKSVCSVCQKE